MADWDVDKQAEMLGNRVRKTFKKLHPAFEQASIGVFRLYDTDIPEIRVVVDWYEGHLVIAEYVRRQTELYPGWLERMASAAAAALGVPPEKVHIKQRRTRPSDGARYGRLDRRGVHFAVRERALRFHVNLDDYLDTGLFADHRETRALVAKDCADREVINLFAYTGSFSVYAAKAGARSTTSVDLSDVYLDWARDNFELNEIGGTRHYFERDDVWRYLADAQYERHAWDVCILDPPSFSTTFGNGDLDILRDQRPLAEAALAILKPGGVLWFSTNHQRFVPDLEGLSSAAEVVDKTAATIPIDYRNKQVHRVFRIRKEG